MCVNCVFCALYYYVRKPFVITTCVLADSNINILIVQNHRKYEFGRYALECWCVSSWAKYDSNRSDQTVSLVFSSYCR